MSAPVRTPITTAEVALVTVALLAFWILHTADLASWRYFAMGDEFEFYFTAYGWTRGQYARLPWAALFNERLGAYGLYPIANSWWHGLLMRTIFGVDIVGLKMMETAHTGAAVLAFYGFFRGLYGRPAAWMVVGLLIPSHYLLGYDHTGYPNLEPLLVTGVALWCAIQVERFPRAAWLWAIGAGVSSGVGWYTNYASRIALVLVFLCFTQCAPRRQWWRLSLWALIGFLPVWLPLLVVTGPADVVAHMRNQSGIGQAILHGRATSAALSLLGRNLGRTLFAFNTNDRVDHYVSGSLVDPVTAVAYVIGVGVALGGCWREWRGRFLLLWLLLTLTTTGVVSPHEWVADTRLFYALPPVVGLAVLALGTYGGQRVIVGVVVAAMALNLHRWFVVTPQRYRQTPHAVTFRVINDLRCRRAPQRSVVVSSWTSNPIQTALEAQAYTEYPVFAQYREDPTPWLADAGKRCIILYPEPLGEWVQALDQLNAHYVATETDDSQLTRLRVYYPRAVR